jgi:hypothetical protein
VKIFALILKYAGDAGEAVSAQEGVAICNKLLREGLKRPELRDELYAQVSTPPRLLAHLSALHQMPQGTVQRLTTTTPAEQ